MNTVIIDVAAIPNVATKILDAVDYPRRVSLVNEGNVAEPVHVAFEGGMSPKFQLAAGVNVVLFIEARVELYATSTPVGGNNVSGTASTMEP